MAPHAGALAAAVVALSGLELRRSPAEGIIVLDGLLRGTPACPR